MTQPFEHWTVLPHGKLVQVDENILTVVGNIRDAAGFGGWLLHIAGFAGKEAQVPTVVKLAVIDDTQALRMQLLQWAEIESLKRILVSHGSPIDENPRQVLRELADTLA